jgi:hypothetical protein
MNAYAGNGRRKDGSEIGGRKRFYALTTVTSRQA